jgi:cytochrome d ubiquinol oxidase subunit I
MALVAAVLLPQIANQTGWYAAEMGRQPYVVYGLLKTSDALSEAVVAEQVLFSLIGFTLVYLVLFLLFIYLMNKKIQHGPRDPDRPDDHSAEEPDHRPLTEEIAEVLANQ